MHWLIYKESVIVPLSAKKRVRRDVEIMTTKNGTCSDFNPNDKQDTSNQIKQCIKIESSERKRLSGGRYFTIAHLYLAPASLSRQNTKIEETEIVHGSCKERRK